MAKIGYRNPSVRSAQPSIEEQTQALRDHGVPEGNIYDSRAELWERLAEAKDSVEVVAASLDRWAESPEDALDSLKRLNEHGASLTLLREGITGATPSNFYGKALLQILLSVEEMKQETIAVKKRNSLLAARKRGTPIGPAPMLSQRDVDWIKERYEVFGWGAHRIAKELPEERNISPSKTTVMRVLGLVKGAKPYVPKDNHKYAKRAAA
ncbi:MAG: recombinase family protein [Leucobacter sp.]